MTRVFKFALEFIDRVKSVVWVACGYRVNPSKSACSTWSSACVCMHSILELHSRLLLVQQQHVEVCGCKHRRPLLGMLCVVAPVSLEFVARREVDGVHAYVQASCCSLVCCWAIKPACKHCVS
jgi:hypothetical protein